MRLREVERGDRVASRLLIGLISLLSRMRLPDAARVAFYYRDFGRPRGAWTQAAMRAPSAWSVGERELMAAMVAKWNCCKFCLGGRPDLDGALAPGPSRSGDARGFQRVGSRSMTRDRAEVRGARLRMSGLNITVRPPFVRNTQIPRHRLRESPFSIRLSRQCIRQGPDRQVSNLQDVVLCANGPSDHR